MAVAALLTRLLKASQLLGDKLVLGEDDDPATRAAKCEAAASLASSVPDGDPDFPAEPRLRRIADLLGVDGDSFIAEYITAVYEMRGRPLGTWACRWSNDP
jgi:hypothetical protein